MQIIKKTFIHATAIAFGAVAFITLNLSIAHADDVSSPDSGNETAQSAPSAPSNESKSSETPSDDSTDTKSYGKRQSLSLPQSQTEVSEDTSDADTGTAGSISATYFGIFYGPGIQNPSSYQPTQNGQVDTDKPVMLKNFLGLGYNITDHVRITPTAYWQWMPTSGGSYSIQDPFIKLSDDSIVGDEEWNLYGDVRYHAPVSSFSQAANLQGSVQSVQVLTFLPQGSRFLMGLYGSEREYFYGNQGYGDDFELYVGPNVSYRLSPSLQLTMLYEINAVHVYHAPNTDLQGDGTDLQPGISWDVANNLNVHPYLSMYPSNPSWQTTSVGMLLYWQAF